ncbi:hypothetical protein BDB00DRAFT_874338 [Zychaea mexicana]|uniref:uncharacterized protein n=1 Tax=Zychaea mexicana TaxID=64656 RepID=UPI0022FEFE65|nr:uncharacterized protein BDB00DRAFT_874338 [Zychaea mexicana]KAI9491445.1 hypothetical protein BDB00DRAFT_874338 [Zychaea mexicana]
MTNKTRRVTESRLFRLYIGNGNWVSLTREVTDDLSEIYKNGKATRYELAPGLLLDILPNDVDCNSKNTDLACLMRVDLCYENDNEEDTQQLLSKYVKGRLEQQGIIDAFPPTRKSDDQLPIVTSLPTHRHLSMVPMPPTCVNRRTSTATRREDTATAVTAAATTIVSSRALAATTDESPQASISNGSKKFPAKKRRTKRRRTADKQESPVEERSKYVDEDCHDLEEPMERLSTATDSALQYQYYAMGHQQQVMLSATPSTYRPPLTTYYGEEKSMLLRTPSPPPVLGGLSSNQHHPQQHDQEHSDSSVENNPFYGASAVLSNTEGQQYSLLSLSHEPQNWTRPYHQHHRPSIMAGHHDHHSSGEHHSIVAAVASSSDSAYYYGNQNGDKMQESAPYEVVACALHHHQDTSLHSVSLSNSPSPQSMLLPTSSEPYTAGSAAAAPFFQSNYQSDRALPHHQQQQQQQPVEYEQHATFLVDSEPAPQD